MRVHCRARLAEKPDPSIFLAAPEAPIRPDAPVAVFLSRAIGSLWSIPGKPSTSLLRLLAEPVLAD